MLLKHVLHKCILVLNMTKKKAAWSLCIIQRQGWVTITLLKSHKQKLTFDFTKALIRLVIAVLDCHYRTLRLELTFKKGTRPIHLAMDFGKNLLQLCNAHPFDSSRVKS